MAAFPFGWGFLMCVVFEKTTILTYKTCNKKCDFVITKLLHGAVRITSMTLMNV